MKVWSESVRLRMKGSLQSMEGSRAGRSERSGVDQSVQVAARSARQGLHFSMQLRSRRHLQSLIASIGFLINCLSENPSAASCRQVPCHAASCLSHSPCKKPLTTRRPFFANCITNLRSHSRIVRTLACHTRLPGTICVLSTIQGSVNCVRHFANQLVLTSPRERRRG